MPTTHKIGEPIGEPRPSVYELNILEHVPWVNPRKYGIKEESVDPRDYFVTSGDAVEKAKVLEKDLWALAGKLRKRVLATIAKERKCGSKKAFALYRSGTAPKKPKKLREYESAVWSAAGRARKLIRALSNARGEDCFLETEWDSHVLLVIPKNPRR
jgi:hypothetical protein